MPAKSIPAVVLLVLLATLAGLTATQAPARQPVTVFLGIPDTKLEVLSGGPFRREITDAAEKEEFEVRIVTQDGRLFWASRNMKPMYASRSGSYIIYHAIDGNGYVKTYDPELAEIAKMVTGEQKHEYMEHLTGHGFVSIVYWGTHIVNRPPPGV